MPSYLEIGFIVILCPCVGCCRLLQMAYLFTERELERKSNKKKRDRCYRLADQSFIKLTLFSSSYY